MCNYIRSKKPFYCFSRNFKVVFAKDILLVVISFKFSSKVILKFNFTKVLNAFSCLLLVVTLVIKCV